MFGWKEANAQVTLLVLLLTLTGHTRTLDLVHF
jgi:hypothetical protein